jgi:hypothetical protein
MPALVNSRVSWLQATIPQGVPFVVGNLHDPHTVLAERIDTLGTVLETRGLLKSLDDFDLVFISRLARAISERLRMMVALLCGSLPTRQVR